jgi:Tfp pilus assembly protein PilV
LEATARPMNGFIVHFRNDERGLTLLETLIAAVLVIILVTGMATFVGRGRASILEEGHKRSAVELAQGELERLEKLAPNMITAVTRDAVVDNLTYHLVTTVTPDVPAAGMKAVRATVSWTLRPGKTRSVRLEASYGMPH